jgi:GNAT superfamily N-acetyltransferase
MKTASAVQLRLARPSEASLVAGILSAAAAKLRERGESLWTAAEVSEAAVAPHIRDGLYHVGLDGGQAVGVFRLQTEDRAFWPEIPDGTSAYLHKLAVVPEKQGHGLGQLFLRHAVAATREKGLRFLRLDCMGGRPKLRAIYETFGFRHHSQKQIGDSLFERFELDLDLGRADASEVR